ncbi:MULTISPECIES: EF-P 5-aminopentanol modification-associated protein YfmF [unclassified Sporosarcina]|uniref:EF-P 5-aminopentanol modification-associated protein YfmF n=1 Tax=unclassified Sporosarcina TaxID=2647733 RepID=UPI002042201D|nr:MULTISPECIES: pitrilysin family protein [unclassified Sporosarcina]GKV64131.1 peptidase M16 [Sporosarcina sp. NCCP-2331]GLB54404.1 peptidase M16 [Sporosarcina sp. NCCP-2378]
MFNKIKLQDGVNLYIRKTEQFKTVNVTIKWKASLEEKSASDRTVLANVLEESNRSYPTQSEMRKALDQLYGTVLFTDVSKRSSQHIVSLYAECVNDEFFEGEDIFKQLWRLIRATVFEPKISDGAFEQAVVDREKRNVRDRIRSIYDDKTRFAQKRMLEIMRPDQPASISAYGTEEAVAAITPESLRQTYDDMINQDLVEIYVVGDIDEKEIIAQIKEFLPFNARNVKKQDTIQSENTAVPVKTVKERQDMKQGKLHLGFSTPITFLHPDYNKMQVMNGIFGGFAHSKLFMNVREKESMAYYANSAFASQYGIVYVTAGIDAELEDKAVKLIIAQLETMQQGDISELELNQTVALLENSIRSSNDSARSQIEIYDQYKELDENFTAEELISKWQAVTIEDVKEMADTVHLEVVYLLSGKEGEEQ